nr:RNA-directed DNA polymerase, eukaryota, reverse transcriptase zinc-binding domain protein [Tanacetum cinerariifolium]
MEKGLSRRKKKRMKGLAKTNKYSILSDYEDDDLDDIIEMANREKVDGFIRMKKQPKMEEMKDWINDMSGVERRKLWKELSRHKSIVNGRSWAVGEDFNVALNVNEHSARSSFLTTDMKEFKECVNQMEVEDLCSSGLHFNWTKNLLQAKRGDLTDILIKLDRVMVNDDFISRYQHAHVIFMPYLISDHSPALLIFPNEVKKRKNPFKFANYLTDKKEFLKIVEDKLSELEACNMVKDVTDKEIKGVMFGIDDNRAPGYDTKGRPKRIACNIDIQKAYDILNWDFLEGLLKQFRFHPKMILWLMVCIRTANFSINVNGKSCSFFQGGRGLRQGDPLSPYLFTLDMEFFTLIMERNVKKTIGVTYHFGCKSLDITHICFADDLLVFSHGNPVYVKVIKDSLEEFGNCFGLLPNFSKSTIFFGGINGEDHHSLFKILPFTKGSLPVKKLYNARIDKNWCVADMLENKEWKWPTEWYDTSPIITSIAAHVLSNSGDKVTWVGVDGATKKFSMKQVYCDLRDNTEKVDRVKVDVIAKLPHPTIVKGVRSFLGHAGFCQRFIQYFSKIARPMTHLLEKETLFVISKDCINAFETLKKKLTEASILVVPD